jgi:PTH2 family peptidyl-tRNA hydrolase
MKENDRVKQIIIVRTDLRNSNGQKVRTGKLIAQSCHASISFLTNRMRKNNSKPEALWWVNLSQAEKEWINGSFFKICLGVDSEKELLDIVEKARNMGVECNLITDQGHTEFNGVPTNTCLALGPDCSDKIDSITGNLKLL